MKLFLVLCSVALALAEVPHSAYNYHERVGIPEAARIKAAEQNIDFDGSRIVGGSTTVAGTYPHLVALVITLTDGWTSVCGSSMLSNTKAVTAAHCWYDGVNQAASFRLGFGSTYLFYGGTRVTASDVETHPDWNPSTASNDLAVITFSYVAYTDLIQPIALPSGSLVNENFAGSWAQAAGYGLTADDADISIIQSISHVTLQVITNAVCQQTFGPFILDSTLCTSGAGGQSTCGGDSGGPLSVNSGNEPVLIGITSFGAAAGCQIGAPAAFVRVTSFLPWIQARL